jgi:hypothetical protein
MRLIKVAGISLVILTVLGWVHPFLFRNEHYERPLSGLSGIAVDEHEKIYCGVPAYGRIQVYSSGGKFVDSWRYTGTQDFRLRINDKKQLEVADANKTRQGDKPDILTVFDLTGRQVSSQIDDECWNRFGAEADTSLRLVSGEILFIPSRYFYPRVIKKSVDGKSTVLIQNSWYNWFIMMPLPTWFWWIIGLLLMRFSQRKYGGIAKEKK